MYYSYVHIMEKIDCISHVLLILLHFNLQFWLLRQQKAAIWLYTANLY